MTILDDWESLDLDGGVGPFQATGNEIRKGFLFLNGKEGELLKSKQTEIPLPCQFTMRADTGVLCPSPAS